MVNVDVLSGTYHIPALFWWPSPQPNGKEYFDVSIGVDPQPRHPSQLPLVEEKRAYLWDQSEGDPRQVLLLTLRNDNGFEVFFIANHVRIST